MEYKLEFLYLFHFAVETFELLQCNFSSTRYFWRKIISRLSYEGTSEHYHHYCSLRKPHVLSAKKKKKGHASPSLPAKRCNIPSPWAVPHEFPCSQPQSRTESIFKLLFNFLKLKWFQVLIWVFCALPKRLDFCDSVFNLLKTFGKKRLFVCD